MSNELGLVKITDTYEVEKVWEDESIGGGGMYVTLPNGIEVSIIRHHYSYGGDEGLFEAWVQDGTDPVGWLTEDDVMALLAEAARR